MSMADIPNETARGDRAIGLARLGAIGVPAFLLILALVLPHFMFIEGQGQSTGPGLGPAAWPDGILFFLGVFSAIWLALELRGLWRAEHVSALSAPVEEGGYSMPKAVVGLGLILLYGWGLSVVGFALATVSYFAVWCWYGGIRRPVTLLIVPLAGTVGLLWLFMGLALMPLPRGSGIFSDFSIALLQVLGIY